MTRGKFAASVPRSARRNRANEGGMWWSCRISVSSRRDEHFFVPSVASRRIVVGDLVVGEGRRECVSGFSGYPVAEGSEPEPEEDEDEDEAEAAEASSALEENAGRMFRCLARCASSHPHEQPHTLTHRICLKHLTISLSSAINLISSYMSFMASSNMTRLTPMHLRMEEGGGEECRARVRRGGLRRVVCPLLVAVALQDG